MALLAKRHTVIVRGTTGKAAAAVPLADLLAPSRPQVSMSPAAIRFGNITSRPSCRLLRAAGAAEADNGKATFSEHDRPPIVQVAIGYVTPQVCREQVPPLPCCNHRPRPWRRQCVVRLTGGGGGLSGPPGPAE